MSPELERMLKEETGYTNLAATCETCMFFSEKADKMIDRSWTPTCSFHSIGDMRVSKASCCNQHKFVGDDNKSPSTENGE